MRRLAGGGRAPAASGGGLARSGLRAAAGLLLVFAALLALPLQAHAQTVETLVSNSGQGNRTSWGVGGGTRGAQKFSVPSGSNYTLSAVTIYVTDGGGVNVAIHEPSNGDSDLPENASLYSLTQPSDTADGARTFEAPAGTMLAGGTDYFVVVTGSDSRFVSVTNSNAEDTTGLTGWTIADEGRRYNGAAWGSLATAIRMGLDGYAIASSDATLSNLELAESGGVAITLNEVFDPDETAYTASVANSVGRIRVTPTTNDANATVEFLDGDDVELTDVGSADGFHVDLNPGDNVIQMKVKAEDDTTTKTYKVTVHRADPPICAEAWCATLTVKNLGSGARGCANSQSSNRCTNTSVLTEDEFFHDDTDYDVTSINVQSNGDLLLWLAPDPTAATQQSLVLLVDSRRFSLALSDGVSSGNRTYRRWSNSGLGWSTGDTVDLKLVEVPNNPATGAPTITGTPQVGQMLTAVIGDIADTDGRPTTFPNDYTFQWVSVDASNTETEVGTDSNTYTPVAADLGSTIRVEVSFTDAAGHAEDPLASDATAAVTATPATPATVTGVAFTNPPSDGVYDLGDTIEVSVTFSEAVAVMGAPQVRMRLAGFTPVAAAYVASASSAMVLVFRYTVTGATDDEPDGVSVYRNGLELNGGTIRKQGTAVDAGLAHGAVTGLPMRTRLVEDIAITSTPRVPATDSGGTPTYGPGEVIEFTVTFGDTVEVTGTPILKGNTDRAGQYDAEYAGGTGSEALRFEWTVPASLPAPAAIWIYSNITGFGLDTSFGLVLQGATLTDSDGRPVNIRHEGFLSLGTNVDAAPPVLSSLASVATVDGVRLELIYRRDATSQSADWLDTSSTPAPGDFTVTVDGTAITVSTVEVANRQTVRLTLSEAVRNDDVVTIDYTPGANPIKDLWGNEVIALDGRAVRNDTAASTDATLESLTVHDGTSDLTLAPPFASGTFAYTAEVDNAVTTVTLTAMTTDDGASVSAVTLDGTAIADTDFTDGITVPSLLVGDNVIAVAVTAENGAIRPYTVTVTRADDDTAAPITVSIAANYPRIGAGIEQAIFTLTRTGPTTDELDVTLNLEQEQSWLPDDGLTHTVHLPRWQGNRDPHLSFIARSGNLWKPDRHGNRRRHHRRLGDSRDDLDRSSAGHGPL